ncbi:MAG: phosphonate metabolism protein/1,5-bisphosphokinase (PRPP-forming) PhnN [Alphaproteobacteria bacterium]|nr:phosphonate metabolism protein/1,5-bisphosphokinase (PRPP-forming) PhnN [Alphaproteobacteria bacterium]
MTPLPTQGAPVAPPHGVGSGALIYVVGPSGSGKDTLLRYARDHLDESVPAAFAHRYITRPIAADSENHIALSEAEFQARLHRQCLAMNWQGHGHRYGVGREIDLWMTVGMTVVVCGSREYLAEAAQRYPKLVPVLISVEADILKQRITARGREDEAEIEQRLQRTLAVTCQHPALITLDNNGPIETAGNALVEIITRFAMNPIRTPGDSPVLLGANPRRIRRLSAPSYIGRPERE